MRRKRNANGVVENFQDVANLMGFEAVCALMLGRRMGFLSFSPDKKVVRLAAAVKLLFVTQRDSNYGMGTWRYWPTKTWRDFVRSEEFIYKYRNYFAKHILMNVKTNRFQNHIGDC